MTVMSNSLPLKKMYCIRQIFQILWWHVYLSNIKARDRYSKSILISTLPDVSDFNNKTLSTQILLGQQERMHIHCKNRYLRALDPTISRESAAHLRPTHISAPTNALKTGHTIFAQWWILIQRMRGCNKHSPSEVCARGSTTFPRWSTVPQPPPIPCPGCSESLYECTKLDFNSYTLNYWETIHPVSVLPGWMGETDIFIHLPQAASQWWKRCNEIHGLQLCL